MSRLVSVALFQLRANIRMSLRYRADFVVGNLGTMVQAAASVAAYLFLFSTLGEVGGWTAGEWTTVLGLVTISRGLWSTFFVGTLDARQLIRTGKFDSYVIRPVGSLFLISTGKVSPDLWGETAVGVFLTVYGIHVTGVEVTFGLIAMLVGALIIGTATYYALFLLVESTSFWLVDNSMLSVLFERLDEYTRVPMSVFPGWMRAMFSSVLPLGMIGYFPGMVVFGRAGAWLIGVAFGVSACFVVMAVAIWRLGVRKYSSTG